MKDDDDDDDDASSSCNTDDVRRVVADSASSLSLEQRRQALLQFYGATHANNNKIMQSSNPDNDNEESDNDDDDDTVDIVTQLLNTNRTKASTKPTRANPNANASSHPSSSLVPHSILDPESLAAAAAAAVWTTPTTTPATTTTPAGGTASLPANKSNTASAAISASSSSAVVAASPGPHRMRLEMAAEIHDTATVTVTTTATATNGGDGETRNPPLPSSSTAAAAAAGSSSSFLPEPVAVEDDSCVAAATTHPRRPPPSPNIPSQVHISTTPTTITTSNNNNNNTTAAAGSVASRTVAFDFSVNGDGRRLPPPPPHWIVPNNNNNRNSCISNTKNDAARQSVTPTPVDNTSTHKNCLGVVHVRLLRAQRLPCPVHSQVQAIVHLHPWKGKVRIAGRRAVPFLAAATSSGGGGGGGDSEYQNHASNNDDDDDSKDDNNDEEKRNDEQFHGVCVEWDDDTSSIVHNNNNNNADNVDLVDDEEMDPTNASSDPAATASMVHAYSDQDSPIPVIQIDLTFTTPILALLEFTMCSLQVPCDVLLQNPNVWRRQWFSTASTVESTTEQTPLIEIQAMFEPLTSSTTDVDDESSTSSESERITFDVEDASYHQIGSQHPSMPLQMQDKTGHQADGHVSELDDSIVDTPAPWSSIVEEQSLIGDPTATLSSSPLRKRRVLTAKKQHLLSIITFRGPACCCVCGKSVMSGPILLLIKKLALRCEACSIDCCDDCRLRVDIELPCGSAVAEQAVANAIQNKLTFDKLLNVIAPLDDTNRLLTTKTPATLDDDTKDRPPVDGLPPSTAPSNSGAAGSARTERGIGTLRMEFVRAHVWTETLPADTDPLSILNEHHIEARLLRPGDYYVRVTWSGSDKTVRTPTIQHSTGRPSLKSGEMRFVVPHYGTEFRIELIDATTDKPIGKSLITTQGLLQQQRDYLVEEKRVPFLSFVRPIRFTEMRHVTIELRSGIKNGFSTDFFLPAKKSSSTDDDVHPGEVVGCIELLASLEEDFDELFGKTPYECPGRPGEELNMSVIQLHMLRISNIIEDVKDCVETYKYVVSWKNPVVTGISLYVLSSNKTCVWDNKAEVHSTRNIKESKENGAINYDVHRPVGLLRVQVVEGRNIRSPELGLPGNVGCRVYWDPTRFMAAKQKKKFIAIDQSCSANHDIGTTNFVYAMNPVWDNMLESDVSRRLKLLMPNQGALFDSTQLSYEKRGIDFPILQPIGLNGDLQVLEPWDTTLGAVVVEIQFFDLLNLIPGSEYPIGEVVVPLREVVKLGGVTGWYSISESDPTTWKLRFDVEKEKGSDGSSLDTPQVFLKVTWDPPQDTGKGSLRDTEREASYAIQEEVVRSALLSRHQKEKFSLLVSSMGAFNSVRGISANLQMVQNSLGTLLDLCESVVHAFDFTDPFKSIFILGVLLAVWLLLSFISLRTVIAVAGLAQYAATFKARFERWLRSGRSSKPNRTNDVLYEQSIVDSPPIPLAVWVMNAIRGLPTSEDLRRTYFWESKRRGAQETESLAAEKRKSRMQRLWRVQWSGTVRMLVVVDDGLFEWRTVFAMIQGHRLLWWRSVGDFDSGVPPIGRLFLAGHVGLSSPSPLELREIRPEDVELVVSIFGSGSRVTILTQSIETKTDLEEAVESAVTNKTD